MRSYAVAAVLLAPLALGACSDDGSGPEPREPASLEIDQSDVQMDDGDTIQVSVSLYDENDEIFDEIPDDVDIFFTSQTPSVVTALPDGRIIAVHPGTGTVRAATSEGLIDEVTILVRPVPTAVEIVSGADQDGVPGEPLNDSVVVRVEDRHGDGVPGVEVAFAVTSGGGSVSPATVTTDAQGLARVEWTLGPVVGDQAIEATIAVASASVAIGASINNVVFTSLALPTTVTQGGTLPGTLRVNSSIFANAVGAAYMVVDWDPAKLQLQPGSLTGSAWARTVRWFDNATGELHVIGTDPDITKGDRALTGLTFDVVGGAGTTTTIDLRIEDLIAENFAAVSASVASAVTVTIN